ncbi:hypothetical protein FRB99_008800 [Tulasnella sp. 403]|nr:hypothetical protein FRB99_008800 [Tulasnella sp. 403]
MGGPAVGPGGFVGGFAQPPPWAGGGSGFAGYPYAPPSPQTYTAPLSNMCAQCGKRPKFGTFEYCGRTCGRAAKNGVPPTAPQPVYNQPFAGGNGYAGNRNSIYPSEFPIYQPPPMKPCKIPDCNKSEQSPGSGYCSYTHRKLGVTKGIDPGCLKCKELPRLNDKTHFCGDKCEKDATSKAPLLLEVPTTDPRFTDVAGQFKTAWKHNNSPPRVAKIYKIILPKTSLDAYETYKRTIEAAGSFSKRKMQPGNERRRWHGTRRQCKIGDDSSNLKFCSNSGCSLCCILKNSYDVKFAAAGMFGKGIYTSATSSKSDTYTRGAVAGSPYKAMFLNRVVVGQGKILTSADSSLTEAPTGFHSVIANPGSGLNYDELIVYNNDAIRPSWLLLYNAT